MKILIFISCITTVFVSFGQSIREYCQEKAFMYSHCFILNQKEKSFAELYSSDDMMRSIGKGVYKETKNKITLYYDKPPLKDTIIYTFNNKHIDTLCVYWTNLWERSEE